MYRGIGNSRGFLEYQPSSNLELPILCFPPKVRYPIYYCSKDLFLSGLLNRLPPIYLRLSYLQDTILSDSLTPPPLKYRIYYYSKDVAFSDSLRFARGDRSVMPLLERFKSIRLVNLESTGISTDTSAILLSERFRFVRSVNTESTRISTVSVTPRGNSSLLKLVNPKSGEISLTRLPARRSSVRWVSPDKDEMSVIRL